MSKPVTAYASQPAPTAPATTDAGHCPAGGRGLNRHGFSLFEMLVALIILAIMAGMAGPSLGRLLDGLKFRQQTRELGAVLRYARLVAVSSGETVHLRLDRERDQCVFLLSGPVEERRECELLEEDVLVMDPGDFYFFPEGNATPGTLTFSKGQKVFRLRLDVLTGRPEPDHG